MKLHSKDLRIGNKIFNGTITEVNEDYFSFSDGYTTWRSNQFPLDTLRPISLTPEVMLMCGYKKYHDTYLQFEIKNAKWCQFGFYKSVKIWRLGLFAGKNMEETPLHHIKYLHQLQNIHYLVTGKELKIKKQKTNEKDRGNI